MSFTLSDFLKDRAHKLTQFTSTQIAALESRVFMRTSDKIGIEDSEAAALAYLQSKMSNEQQEGSHAG